MEEMNSNRKTEIVNYTSGQEEVGEGSEQPKLLSRLLFGDFLWRFQSQEREGKAPSTNVSRKGNDVSDNIKPLVPKKPAHQKEIEIVLDENKKIKIPDEIIRPELNIEKHADFIFIPAHSKKIRQARRREGWVVMPDGRRERSFLEIHAGINGRTPTTTTRKIYLAIQKLYEEKKHAGKLNLDGSIVISSREILKTAMLVASGNNTRLVHNEIETLRSCMFKWVNIFIGHDGERYELLSTANILDKYEYVSRKKRDTQEKLFQAAHVIRFGEHIRKNLDTNKTKPVSLTTVLSIQGELALVLYTRLDIILSDKEQYSRTTKGMFEDLNLSDEPEYKYPSARKRKLEKAIKELDGKFISTGILKLHLERTVNGEDWKLIVNKIPVLPPTDRVRAFPKSPSLNSQDMITYLAEDIGEAIGSYEKNQKLYERLAATYPKDLIYQAISECKADGENARDRAPFFVAIVHRLAHQRGRDWIKPCPKNCKYRS